MLDVQREGGVAKVFLDRPEKANALDAALLARPRDACRCLSSQGSRAP